MPQWTVSGLFDQETQTLLVAGVFEGDNRARDAWSLSGGTGRFSTVVDAANARDAERQATAAAEGGPEPEFDDDVVLTFTRGQVNAWADRRLDDDELDRLEEALPLSALPETVRLIADSMRDGDCSGYEDGEP